MRKILITQRSDFFGKYKEIRDNLDIRILNIVKKIHSIPILVPNDTKLLKNMIKYLDFHGIILSPGANPLKKDQRYHVEKILISYALKNNIPLLGICRGSQAINIFFNGKLKKIKNHVKKKHNLMTKLSKKKVITNCYHEYAITKNLLGSNLKILGLTKDNNIELFKHKKKNIYGMMWHPERSIRISNFDKQFIKRIFKWI